MSKITIELSFDNIYNSAICNFKCHSNTIFNLEFKEKYIITNLNLGKLINNNKIQAIQAQENENSFVIDLNLIGLIREKKLKCGENISSVEHYGMQFFPYLSSEINLNIESSITEINCISIKLPDTFRIIWFKWKMHLNNLYNYKKTRIEHSQSTINSTYILIPDNFYLYKNKKKNLNIKLLVPVRYGGKELTKYIIFPIMYFVTSFIVIYILIEQNKIDEAKAALLAFFGLMIERFTNANPPQNNTILSNIYITLSLILTYWLLYFTKMQNVINTIYHYAILCILIFTSLFSLLSLIYMNLVFSRSGFLPKYIEKFFYKRRVRNEYLNKNK